MKFKPGRSKVVHRRPDMAQRLEKSRRGNTSAAYLFDVREDTNPETVAILVRHWKGKHHPDKGGSTDDFQLINSKADNLTTNGVTPK